MVKRTLTSLCALVVSGLAVAMVPDAPGVFPGVGRVGDIVSGNMTTVGTGFAVSPNWIMTASHVGGSRFELDGQIYTVVQTIHHPTADIALKRVVGPMTSALPIKIDTFPAGLPAVQSNMSGQILHLSGFGLSGNATATGWSFIANSSGVRRLSRNAMDLYSPNVQVDLGGGNIKTSNYVFYDLDDPAGLAGPNILGGPRVGTDEGGMSISDSGCPFTVSENSRFRAVAIGGIVGTFNGTGVLRPYDWGGFGAGVILQGYESWFLPFITDIKHAIIDGLSYEVGSQIGGNIAAIAESDNVRMTTRTDTTAVDSDTQLGMIVYTTATGGNTGSMKVTIEGRLSASASSVQVRMRNWSTNQFVNVGNFIISNVEQTYTISGINAAPYVNALGKSEVNLRFNPLNEDMRLLDGYFDVIRVEVL